MGGGLRDMSPVMSFWFCFWSHYTSPILLPAPHLSSLLHKFYNIPIPAFSYNDYDLSLINFILVLYRFQSLPVPSISLCWISWYS